MGVAVHVHSSWLVTTEVQLALNKGKDCNEILRMADKCEGMLKCR